jgi:hypothetical protein
LDLYLLQHYFFVSTIILQHKFSRLSDKVSAILEPNVKIIKLKAISSCLYSAEKNIKAYTINLDPLYLLQYEKDINLLNTHLDTLLIMSSTGGIVDTIKSKSNYIFSARHFGM